MYISPENILRDACTMSLPVFLITIRDQKETGSSEIQYLHEDFFEFCLLCFIHLTNHSMLRSIV